VDEPFILFCNSVKYSLNIRRRNYTLVKDATRETVPTSRLYNTSTILVTFSGETLQTHERS